MSFSLPTQRTQTAYRSRWSGVAFLIEAMLLLVFVMASLAVFTQLFAESGERANQSKALTDAVAIASTTAERFAADPQGIDSRFEYEGLLVTCDVTSETRAGGTLWHADIAVYSADEPKAAPGQALAAVTEEGAADTDANGQGAVAADAQGGPLYSISTAVYESGV